MKIGIIKNESQYDDALARIETLIDDGPSDEAQHDELGLLALIIGDYEDRTYPIAPPDPIDAIWFAMEQKEIKNPQALAEILGWTSGRVSELLNRKRALTLEHIRRLNTVMDVPLESLMAEYELNRPGGLRDQPSNEE